MSTRANSSFTTSSTIRSRRPSTSARSGSISRVAGFADFNGDGSTDMMLRNRNTGQFELYDIVNNQITTANSLGAVGLNFQVGGFAANPATASTGGAGSTAQLVQAMAAFGGGDGAADGLNIAPLGADASQTFLTQPHA